MSSDVYQWKVTELQKRLKKQDIVQCQSQSTDVNLLFGYTRVRRQTSKAEGSCSKSLLELNFQSTTDLR